MLRSTLIHPDINRAIARSGHHGLILIADGNYPASTKRGPNAEVVALNLMPGVVTCVQALQAILAAVPIDAARTMGYETEGPYALSADPPIWDEFRATLEKAGSPVALEPIFKWDFYEAVATTDHILTIQTGDNRPFANLLLTIGVRVDAPA